MEQNLKRLGELDHFKVASDDPDVRGWDVKTRDGREIGEVEELIVDTDARKVRYLEVGLDRETFGLSDTRRVSIPVESADVDTRDRAVFVKGMSTDAIASLPASQYHTQRSDEDRTEARLSRSEEELRVGKRREQVGEVLVGKHVETERVSEPVTVERERVRVERRPVEGDARNAEARFEEDEIRIPVVEEELVVDKRPVVKEELVISKETERDVEHVDEVLRKERFDIHKEGRVADVTPGKPRRTGGE